VGFIIIMQIKIVKLSELGINCWSPNRFFDSCHECSKCDTCKREEGVRGDIVLRKMKLEEAMNEVAILEKEIEEVTKKLNDRVVKNDKPE